jgi:hypothetical protein
VRASTNGSFFDYYAEDHRQSQGLEITEYADGRVVWNIVNALRSHDGHAAEEEEGGSRASMVSLKSQSSNYTGSRRESARMDDHTPWHVGPTQGLSFMRRPETRVFYTNSADVADLIDQLSMDHADATHGRIDIRPTGLGFSSLGAGDDRGEPSPDFSEPSAAGYGPPRTSTSQAAAGGFLQPNEASASSTSSSTNASSPLRHLYPSSGGHHGSKLSVSTGSTSRGEPDRHTDIQSPTSTSFRSDTSVDKTVEDRLQALMDRLRSAPGGMGSIG